MANSSRSKSPYKMLAPIVAIPVLIASYCVYERGIPGQIFQSKPKPSLTGTIKFVDWPQDAKLNVVKVVVAANKFKPLHRDVHFSEKQKKDRNFTQDPESDAAWEQLEQAMSEPPDYLGGVYSLPQEGMLETYEVGKDGRFVFKDLPPGVAYLVVHWMVNGHTGDIYQCIPRKVNIHEGQTTHVDILLLPIDFTDL